MRTAFTEAELEYISTHYRHSTAEQIAERLGRSAPTIRNKARTMGLTGKKRGWAAIPEEKRKLITAAKKIEGAPARKESAQVRPQRERAMMDGEYHYIRICSEGVTIETAIDTRDDLSDNRFRSGNYYLEWEKVKEAAGEIRMVFSR